MAQIDIELAKLKETKASIAQSITAKGGTLSNPSDFSSYSIAIDNLPSSGGGLGFEQIGYATTPEPFKSGLEYAKQIKDNWDSSITDCYSKYENDKQLYFFPIVNVDNVTNMNYMFQKTNLLVTPTLHTPKCAYAIKLFNSCKLLSYADLSNWTLSNVSSMDSMFKDCENVTTIVLPKGLRPTNAYMMFSGCKNLTQVNIGDVDFSQCTNMALAFSGCPLSVIPNLDTRNCTRLDSTFPANYNLLVRIEGIDMVAVTNSGSKLFGTLYSDNQTLRYLNIKNFGNSNIATPFTNFKRLKFWGLNDTANPDAKQSLIDTFITNSMDRSSNPMTVNLHADVLARFTADEIQQAANKGYNLTK